MIVHSGPNEDGVVQSTINLTLCANTDGMAPYDRTTAQIWPVWSVINEFPMSARMKEEFMLLHHIWPRGKPAMNVFMGDVAQELNKLSLDGMVLWKSPGRRVIVKIEVFCFTCDAPAKAGILMHVLGTGFWGCPHCMEQGESVKTGTGPATVCNAFIRA